MLSQTSMWHWGGMSTKTASRCPEPLVSQGKSGPLWCFTVRKLLTYSNHFCQGNGWVFSQVLRLSLLNGGHAGWIEYSSHRLTISSVCVSSWPYRPSTTWAGPCYPFLTNKISCQNILEANPNFPSRWEKFSWRYELKSSQTGASDRCSRFTFTIHLGLRGPAGILPCQWIQLTMRWWSVDSSAHLFTPFLWASKTYVRRSDDTTTKSVIDLWPKVAW